ncbi:hypothetical protein [Methanoculleus sp.]|uniref:MnhB domain-containing protein n=1 Tax=Methanoculleus sp. TaxID=90427 RepID=UPI0025DB2BEF|nr:hypothetical protein [Methanoculleus sp.]
MHESRLVSAAIGTVFALVVAFYAMHGTPAPGGLLLGGMAILVGVALPFFTPGAKAPSIQVAGRPIRKTEILGLLIFILMAVVMLVVGTALFWDWLAEPASAPVGTPIDLGPVSGGLRVAGSIPAMALVIGVEVIGGISLIALYMLSSLRRGA